MLNPLMAAWILMKMLLRRFRNTVQIGNLGLYLNAPNVFAGGPGKSGVLYGATIPLQRRA
jgi:hypothetical protein